MYHFSRVKSWLLFCLLATCLGSYIGYIRAKDDYAIVLYATDRQYLCNTLINVVRLRNYGTKAQLIVLLPEPFLDAKQGTPIARIVKALLLQDVVLEPIFLERSGLRVDDVTYEHSLQKLEILRIRSKRLLYFDSDGLILRRPDHLFAHTPEADLTLPEAYYATQHLKEDKLLFSSAFMLIKPSLNLYRKAQKLVQERRTDDFDMEIINKLTHDNTISNTTLPYRGNILLTGLFRDHSSYSRNERWDPEKEWSEASYIHFSDSPIPKPWIDDRGVRFAQHGPKCLGGGLDCPDVKIWRAVHNAFKDEMRVLCPSPKEISQ